MVGCLYLVSWREKVRNVGWHMILIGKCLVLKRYFFGPACSLQDGSCLYYRLQRKYCFTELL